MLTFLKKSGRALSGAVFYPVFRVASAIPRLAALLEAMVIKYPAQQLFKFIAALGHLQLWIAFQTVIETFASLLYHIPAGIGFEIVNCLISPLSGLVYGWNEQFWEKCRQLTVRTKKKPKESTEEGSEKNEGNTKSKNVTDYIFDAIEASNDYSMTLYQLLSPRENAPPLHWALRVPYTILAIPTYIIFRAVIAVPRLVALVQSAAVFMVTTLVSEPINAGRRAGMLGGIFGFFIGLVSILDKGWKTLKLAFNEVFDVLKSPVTGPVKAWNGKLKTQVMEDLMATRPSHRSDTRNSQDELTKACAENYEAVRKAFKDNAKPVDPPAPQQPPRRRQAAAAADGPDDALHLSHAPGLGDGSDGNNGLGVDDTHRRPEAPAYGAGMGSGGTTSSIVDQIVEGWQEQQEHAQPAAAAHPGHGGDETWVNGHMVLDFNYADPGRPGARHRGAAASSAAAYQPVPPGDGASVSQHTVIGGSGTSARNAVADPPAHPSCLSEL